MTDKSKRQFFSTCFVELFGRCMGGIEAGLKEAEQKTEFSHFFENYESSYALTLAYPDDILIETARIHGIKTEGRPKLEIVKELFIKKGGY